MAFFCFIQKTDRAGKKGVKVETPDLLSLCHDVPFEVVKLGWFTLQLIVMYSFINCYFAQLCMVLVHTHHIGIHASDVLLYIKVKMAMHQQKGNILCYKPGCSVTLWME